MPYHEILPGFAIVPLRPDVGRHTAHRWARQIGKFMRREVQLEVYERGFGLKKHPSTEAQTGSPGDRPWRVESMRAKNFIVQPPEPGKESGVYREYLGLFRLSPSKHLRKDDRGLAGVCVVEREGLWTPDNPGTTEIVELSVAPDLYGTGAPYHMLNAITEAAINSQVRKVTLEVYGDNERAMNAYGKLGFVINHSIAPRQGDLYDGLWVTMEADGDVYAENLQQLVSAR